jgi:hypothetical protein
MSKKQFIFSTSFIMCLLPSFLLAGTATIEWVPNPETDLKEYKVYHGATSRNYSAALRVGNVTAYTFDNLEEGITHYFAVTAVDTANNESRFSAEVTKYVADTQAPPARAPASASVPTHVAEPAPQIFGPTPQISEPAPQITANGHTGWVNATSSEPVTIAITMDAGDMAGHLSDWWIVVSSPFGLLSYVFPSGWQEGLALTVQAPLFDLAVPYPVLQFNLPVGEYTFFLAVDDNADGQPDGTYLDYVIVQVN